MTWMVLPHSGQTFAPEPTSALAGLKHIAISFHACYLYRIKLADYCRLREHRKRLLLLERLSFHFHKEHDKATDSGKKRQRYRTSSKVPTEGVDDIPHN